jgi:hypothetical protein
MQEAPETPSTLLREYTIPFGMIEVPSLLPYLWITNIEGIVKVWARRVIKSSLVGDHFASPASFQDLLESSEKGTERIFHCRGAIKVELNFHQHR